MLPKHQSTAMGKGEETQASEEMPRGLLQVLRNLLREQHHTLPAALSATVKH